MALIGKVDKTYISSINFLDQREILEEVLDVTSEDATILDIMEMTGKMSVTDVPTYDHFENAYLYNAGTIASVSATAGEQGDAAGEKIVITQSAAASPEAAGDELPLVNELAMFVNKQIGIVSAVNQSTRVVTIEPLSASAIMNPSGTEVVAAGPVIYFSNASSEGSLDPEGRKPRFNRSQNSIQIFKTSGKITDLQKVSKVEVKYGGKEYIMYKLQHDVLQKHRSDIAFSMLVGQKSLTTDVNTGDPIYTTQGLRNYILGGDGTVNTTGGVDVPLSTTITLANIRTMNRALDKRGVGPETWGWFGGDLLADFDTVVGSDARLVGGGISYNSFGIGNGKNRAVDLGIDSVRLQGRTLHVKKLAAYDHPEVFGQSAFDFASEGYILPTGKIKADKSGTMRDRISVRYMSGDGTDLKHLEVLTGKLAPTPTDTEAALKVGYESVMGLQALGIRQFGIFSKV